MNDLRSSDGSPISGLGMIAVVVLALVIGRVQQVAKRVARALHPAKR